MAGLIRDDDIALVRERARIDEVVADHVMLRGAGGGSKKGLCPFHDEKSPSFHVTPSRGFYHCFGCGEGGDVITFVQKVEGVGFTEAVERLAERFGVELHYEDGGVGQRRDFGQRSRLVEAHRIAAEFYRDQLAGPDALKARQFLAERGFDRGAAEHFGLGFAPRAGDALFRHLRGRKVSEDDMVTAGLVGRGGRGPYDRFRGRLLWPIRETSGEVIGFGARRIFDDDRIDAKYLNTPETPIYKKSHVLYGVDLARKEIGRAQQCVIVEGYTDVMACHLAGVKTAVATCGTAFGEDHARVVRRLLLDHDQFRGEVIYTFDGDEAGQKAALKAFAGDQQFVGQTYVAVEREGRDPCDLRLAEGDAAVRELVARRVPLYRFVLDNVLRSYDLDRADQRVDAVREAAGLVAHIRDRSKIDAFSREIAGLVGVDVGAVRREVSAAAKRPPRQQRERVTSRRSEPDAPAEPQQSRRQVPDPHDRRYEVERAVLKLIVQHPQLCVGPWTTLEAQDFTHPWYREVFDAYASHGGPAQARLDGVVDDLSDSSVKAAVSALAVEPLRLTQEPTERVVSAYTVRLRELTVLRRIDDVKSKLQRTNPVSEATEYNRMFGELVALETHRRELRETAIGVES